VSRNLAELSERIRPLRRVEYDQLVESGRLANEKVELIRGLIIRMSPQGPRHAAAVQNLSKLLMAAVGIPGRADVRVQLPLALGEDSEPEPDLAAVPPGSYKEQHPTRAFLVIEIGDSSLAVDRRTKMALYAEHDVSEYWIVDIAHERVEVHSEAQDGTYTRVSPYRLGNVLSSTVLPEVQIRVDEIFR
jgi:Uma2 family endonuclease